MNERLNEETPLTQTQMWANAVKILGREPVIITLVDGSFTVEWFNFNAPPPPKGKTPRAALLNFLSHIDKIKETIPVDDGDTLVAKSSETV